MKIDLIEENRLVSQLRGTVDLSVNIMLIDIFCIRNTNQLEWDIVRNRSVAKL